jgi:bifunctional pyridoxal-dependent enzyme with beta-cystathionase and maltose regulon repressor activities
VSEEIAQHSIICTAPSKTFNVAGLLTSNLIIPNESLKNKVFNYRNDHAIYFCNMLGYKACEIAYNECEDWLEELLIVLNENRILIKNFMNDYIPEINVIELEGTYLQWLDCRKLGMSPKELEKFMVDEAYLFVDEGYVFGEAGEGFERINLACPTWVLKESLERMYTAWQKHKNR